MSLEELQFVLLLSKINFSTAFALDNSSPGTKVFDKSLNKDVLYLPANTTETWQQHFIGTGSSSSPQFNNMNALIAANNDNYLEPAPATGSFIEEFDFGTQLASTKITVTQGGSGIGSGNLTHSGIINTGTDDSGSFTNDGVEQTGTSFSRFGTQFQRVKYEVKETSTNGKYRKITSINCKLDTKILNDTGIGSCTANQSDNNGKEIDFNVDFVDVQGIAVTPNGAGTNIDGDTTKKLIAVVDFQDVPNPTSFKVFLFDLDGYPKGGKFTWQARVT